jgi:hypothetical protein
MGACKAADKRRRVKLKRIETATAAAGCVKRGLKCERVN